MNDRISYNVPAAAKAVGLSRATIFEAIRRGDLRSFKLMGRRLILAEELEAWVQRAARAQSDGTADDA